MKHSFNTNRATLKNGLRLIHSYDPTTAMVAVNVLYDVGSRDEVPSLTGMAHLFEHLMFGGSVNAESFDEILEHAGGKNNAWTSADFTNFYCTVPAQNIATAFFLESDRMLELAFSSKSLEVQRSVVVEEFKQTCLDQPYGDLMHRLRKAVYGDVHPYGWPTIGLEPAHIESVTLDDVRRWFYAHYAPNNAILSVVGNATFEDVLALAEKWFGDIPARDIAKRNLPAPELPKENIDIVVEDDVPGILLCFAFPMDHYGTKGYFAADAITDLLAAGRSARFTTQLVNGYGRGLFAAADASIIGSEHEGLLLMTARLGEDSTEAIDRAKNLMLEEARKLAQAGNIGQREFERSLNNFEATFRFSNVGLTSRAQNLAMAEYHGEDINRTVEDRRALSVDDVAATADKLFNHTPFVAVTYRPKSH